MDALFEMPFTSGDKIKVFGDVTWQREWVRLYACVPYGNIVLEIPYSGRGNAITMSDSAWHLGEGDEI